MDSLIHLTSVTASNLTEHLSNNEWMLDHASLEIILVEYFFYNTEHCHMLVHNITLFLVRQRRKQKFKLSIGGGSKNVNAVCNMGLVPPVRSTRKNSIIHSFHHSIIELVLQLFSVVMYMIGAISFNLF
jgi:hypothetical protein